LFGLLATYYLAELNRWIIKHHGLIHFFKRDFYPCFKKAWQAVFKELNIQSSWTKTGLNLFNPSIMLNKLRRPQSEQPSGAEELLPIKI
ncbi:hypothetical protein EV356DRAFT_458453, partial [Viridothelium virens]